MCRRPWRSSPPPSSPNLPCSERLDRGPCPPARHRLPEARIRTVPDWPQAGVQLQVTSRPCCKTRAPSACSSTLSSSLHGNADRRHRRRRCALHPGASSPTELNKGFGPVRKKGKLPFTTVCEECDWNRQRHRRDARRCHQAGRPRAPDRRSDRHWQHRDGQHRLIQRLGSQIVEAAAIVDLPELGRSVLLKEPACRLYRLRI